MVEGPCCSNLSCTSACGMQHLPTHNPFSSSPPFPHQFIQNPAHSPDVSIARQPVIQALGSSQDCKRYPRLKELSPMGQDVPSANYLQLI